jgi:hypothetical protein
MKEGESISVKDLHEAMSPEAFGQIIERLIRKDMLEQAEVLWSSTKFKMKWESVLGLARFIERPTELLQMVQRNEMEEVDGPAFHRFAFDEGVSHEGWKAYVKTKVGRTLAVEGRQIAEDWLACVIDDEFARFCRGTRRVKVALTFLDEETLVELADQYPFQVMVVEKRLSVCIKTDEKGLEGEFWKEVRERIEPCVKRVKEELEKKTIIVSIVARKMRNHLSAVLDAFNEGDFSIESERRQVILQVVFAHLKLFDLSHVLKGRDEEGLMLWEWLTRHADGDFKGVKVNGRNASLSQGDWLELKEEWERTAMPHIMPNIVKRLDDGVFFKDRPDSKKRVESWCLMEGGSGKGQQRKKKAL